MQKANQKILVILGPTASGKSSLAIDLARKINGEIISADSRQIYRGMDLGTGKVTRAEQRLVKHWMLDIVSPRTKYNVAKFKKTVDKIILNILKRGKTPIICGGTGFWIKAIVENVNFPAVKPDWKLRKTLQTKSVTKLFQQLKKIDPERATSIDPQNKVRLIRAIEIAKKIGKTPILVAGANDTHNYNFLQIGIKLPQKKLNQNIQKRLAQRIRSGMIVEVKKLHGEENVSWKRLEDFGLEYRWISRYLQKEISRREMEEKLYFDIVHYAKRQMTWFRKTEKIRWMTDRKKIYLTCKNFLERK